MLFVDFRCASCGAELAAGSRSCVACGISDDDVPAELLVPEMPPDIYAEQGLLAAKQGKGCLDNPYPFSFDDESPFWRWKQGHQSFRRVLH